MAQLRTVLMSVLVICGWVLWVMDGYGADATAKVEKFRIPVWHPDARWQMDKKDFMLDSNLCGELDGPRHEFISAGSRKRPQLAAGISGSGRYTFMGYDAKGDRFHVVTGGAAGNLNGPFSRARMYLSDYHGGHERAHSPDDRFYYYLDQFYKQQMRVLDFAKQWVSTLPAKGSAVACGKSGKVYLTQGINPVTSIVILSPGPEWKLLKTIKAQGNRRLVALGSSIAVDEKNGRLYATTYGTKDWYVWRWDLKDGSFHGVLPNCYKKPGARKKNQMGPFEGTVVYNHGEIAWGPDDPDKRFLYMSRVDTFQFFRLDLEKKIIAGFCQKEGRFVEQGAPRGDSSYSAPPYWMADGSFVGAIPWYAPAPNYRYFKRVK